MKVFFVVAFFLFFIALFAGGIVGDADLTPDTPPDPNRPLTSAPSLLMGSGPCGAVYAVRSGDTLSSIARTCGVEMADLMAANPNITDPNMIYVDQRINIPASGQPQAAAPTTAVVPTAVAPASAQPSATPKPASSGDSALEALETAASADSGGSPLPEQPSTSTPDLRNTYQPGTQIILQGKDIPAETYFYIMVGKAGETTMVTVGDTTSDASGGYNFQMMVPSGAVPGEQWSVALWSPSDISKKHIISTFTVK